MVKAHMAAHTLFLSPWVWGMAGTGLWVFRVGIGRGGNDGNGKIHTKAQEDDFSPVHLAPHHPQPPKHPQGHGTVRPWVSLQESHPTSLPTLNSQPHHFFHCLGLQDPS